MEAITKKFFGRYKEPLAQIPNLVEMQKKSYELLVAEGLAEGTPPEVRNNQKVIDAYLG